MQQTIQNLLASYPGLRVIKQEQLTDDSYYVDLQGMIGGELVHMRTQLYVRGKRVYFVSSSTWNLSGPNKIDVPRFFTSFRIL
jgi:hypothetical protein